MITRTTKYTASDGTEHASPQEAAAYDLQKALEPLMGLAVKDLFMGEPSSAELAEMARELARNPEALRDAVNTYFEDLEAHPDVEDYSDVNPAILRRMMGDGVMSEATDEEIHRGTSCDKPLSPLSALEGVTLTAPQEPPPPDVDDPANVFHGMAADKGDIESVSIYQHGAWQHFDVREDGSFTTNLEGTFQLDGDPEDPSTWRVELREGEVAPGVRGFEMEVPSYRGTCNGQHPPGLCPDPQCWQREQSAQGLRENLPADHPQYCRPFGTRED